MLLCSTDDDGGDGGGGGGKKLRNELKASEDLSRWAEQTMKGGGKSLTLEHEFEC